MLIRVNTTDNNGYPCQTKTKNNLDMHQQIYLHDFQSNDWSGHKEGFSLNKI